MYPLLADFSGAVIGAARPAATRKVLIDLSKVTYVDSATIGCLMDLYRQTTAAGGELQAGRRAEARRDDADDDRRAQLPRDVPGRGERRQELRGASHAHHQDDHRRRRSRSTATCSPCSRRSTTRSPPGASSSASFEDMVAEIHHLIDQMTDERAPRLPGREPVPQHGEVRERQARGVHEEAAKSTRSKHRTDREP